MKGRRLYGLLGLSLAGCMWAAPLAAEESASIPAPRIAVLLPLSGDYQRLGDAAMDGLRWAADELPMALTLEPHDTQGDPALAAALVADLAADPDVLAIVGPIGAKESMAAAQAAAEAKIPILTLTSVEGVEDVGRTVFRLRVSAETQARSLAQLAVGVLERKRAAVFYPADEYGAGCMRAFVEAYTAAGGRVTAIEGYEPDESKPTKEAELLSGMRLRRVDRGNSTKQPPSTTLKKRARAHVDFDTLFIPDQGAQVARALSFLAVAGVTLDDGHSVQLLGTSGWTSGGLAGAERLAVGALVAQAFDPHQSDRVEGLVAYFQEQMGRSPTALEAQSYDAALILSHAARRCVASASRDCLVQGLLSQGPVEGVMGPVRLSQRGAPIRDLVLFDVDDQGQLWRTD
jgi:ABC-type branched-subunit amino acid transport system substrate-binding protein